MGLFMRSRKPELSGLDFGFFFFSATASTAAAALGFPFTAPGVSGVVLEGADDSLDG